MSNSDATPRPRILVAEDNRVMGNVLAFALERAGYDTTLARTGSEAVERIRTTEFDFVLTDYQMPGASGLDVCRAVREFHGSTIPVLFCSAKGLELDIERLKGEFGVIDVVFKPFSTTAILNTIRETLEVAAV